MDPWITEHLMGTNSACAPQILEDLMAQPQASVFGPVHHVQVGGALLSAYRNAADIEDAWLAGALRELDTRAGAVPGGACARWGICGAAVSAGAAWSIINGNAPTITSGWSECQLMVSRISEAIALSGPARCCKRDARIAVRLGADAIARTFDIPMEPLSQADAPTCIISEKNSVCAGSVCPYHRA